MSASADSIASTGPDHGFADSRRLTGHNRWCGGTAVTLCPLGSAARNRAAHAAWAANVQTVCMQLHWPAPGPQVHVAPDEVTLVFAAPADALFTATDVNEWAWERAAAQHGERAFDLAQDLGDADAALPVFAARAAAEHNAALAALQSAAAQRQLLVLADDDTVSVGAGSGSSAVWPLSALPTPQAVDWPALHGVPTALVTGSNGKTTTVRLLAAIARQAGLVAGYCSTEGVVVDGVAVHGGDYAGPAGARAVLRDTRVQLAVLETARGGILRRGLALDHADVAVVTNISPDHLGEYGVEDAADLAEVKLVVAHAVCAVSGDEGRNGDVAIASLRDPPGPSGSTSGTLALNADDPVLMAAAARLPQVLACRWALFAMDDAHPALAALRTAGGNTCGVDAHGHLRLWHQGQAHDLGAVAQMPLTLNGAARHNVQNAACAALAAVALGLSVPAVVSTLSMFGSAPQHNPGRLERWSFQGATVLVDYAHNPDGLAQLLTVARALQATDGGSGGRPDGGTSGRLGLLLGQAGNRDDAAVADLARVAAGFAPDHIVIKELPQMLRGRAVGAVPALLQRTLLAAGMAPARLESLPDEEAAARRLLAWARPGDVVVLPVHTTAVRQRLATLLAQGQDDSDSDSDAVHGPGHGA